MKNRERVATKGTHHLFYFLMIAVPFLGWLMVSVSTPNIPTKIFKIIPWPHFPGMGPSESLESLFTEMHELMAYAIFFLFLMHVGAALKHHFINRDDVLTRMLPFLRQRK